VVRRGFISLGDPYLDKMLGRVPRGNLVLVAGSPGTGKTIFSAQVAYVNMMRGLKAAYLSLAEPKELFMQCMKGLGMNFKRMEAKGLFKFYDLASPRDPSFMERMLEETLKEVLAWRANVLVVDSLSALIQLVGRDKARSLAHTMFSRVVRSGGITTVAVAEAPLREGAVGVEEFVADFVFFLSKREIEARLGRQLEVVKARGARVAHPRLLFTLHGGFKVIEPFTCKHPEEPRRFQPVEETPRGYSTGIPDLDAVLGGYPKNGVVHFEVGENVETSMYHVLVVPTLVNFVVKGRGLIVFPSMGVDARVVQLSGHEYGIRGGEFDRLVRVVQLAPPHPSAEDWVVEIGGEDFKEDYQRWLDTVRELQRITGSSEVTSFIGADSLHSQYGEDDMYRFLALEALRTRVEGGLLIALTKPGLEERVVKSVSNVANIHLKLVRRRGALLLYGLIPRTELYAVSLDLSKGYPMPRLTPIL